MEETTWTTPLAQAEAAGQSVHLLTVIWHPAWRLIGAQAVLPPPGQPARVNRFEPLFAAAGRDIAQALEHGSVSRAPLVVEALEDGGVRVSRGDPRLKVEVYGEPLETTRQFDAATVACGVMITLGHWVVLCLHRSTLLPTAPLGRLLGISDAMEQLRRQVRLVAATDQPVLVLGETGTGKELVAQAVHQFSPRHGRPLVAVNMASLGDSMAAAELFGSARGAYTGSVGARSGVWAEAEGGTLFLDEIGDTPESVQPMLLRTIETGEYRPLGANRPVRANVRLIAATDRPLHSAAFNQPLLHRLESFVIRTPPLRERRQDLGVLIHQCLAHGLDSHAEIDWLVETPPPLVRGLCRHAWPGNVRQLLHAVQRLKLGGPARLWPSLDELFGMAAAHSAGTAARVDDVVAPERSLPDVAGIPGMPHTSSAARTAAPRIHRSTADITPQALIDALDRHGWCLQDAALALGVSRPSIYNLLERHPGIRRADDIALDEILPLLAEQGASLSGLATRLRTPREALRRRLRSLGLPTALLAEPAADRRFDAAIDGAARSVDLSVDPASPC